MKEQKGKKIYNSVFKYIVAGFAVSLVMVLLGIILQCTAGDPWFFLIAFGAFGVIVLGLLMLTEKNKCIVITDTAITFHDEPELNGKELPSITVPFVQIAFIREREKGFLHKEYEYDFVLKDGNVVSYEFEHTSQSDIYKILEILRQHGVR